MTLEEIVIRNYGAFGGENIIDVRPAPHRNIILFGGRNGSGKTTLLEAIRLCFYGKQFAGGMSRQEYEELLASRIHRSATSVVQPTEASVSVLFTYGEEDGPHTFLVTRSWTKKHGKRVEERFELLRDGHPVEDVSDEYWEDFLLNLIPPSISDLFFFDGEQIQTLADDTGDGRALSDAIKSLLGVDIVERLQADLRIYSSRALSDCADANVRAELASAEQEVTALQGELEAAERPLAELQHSVSHLQQEIQHAETAFVSSGGTFAKNWAAHQEQQTVLRTRIADLENRVRLACGGLMPLAIARELGDRVQNQLEAERMAQDVAAQNKVLSRKRGTLVGKLEDLMNKSRVMSNKARADIVTTVEEALADIPVPRTVAVHSLSSSAAEQVRTQLGRAIIENCAEMKQIAGELEKLHRRLHKLEKDMASAPSQVELAPKLAELGSLHARLGAASSEAIRYQEKVLQLQAAVSEAQRKFEKKTKTAASLVSAQSNANAAIKAVEALNEFKQRLIDKRLSELETVAAECFSTLLRKKRWVGHICVNPDTYSVTIRTASNHIIQKSQLSAGEKQIYAIAMLWALAKLSQRPLPTIIDTPLARLDSEHRRLLVKSYFPVASHQVVVLSTDTEIDHDKLGELSKFVSRSYKLEFDPLNGSTTVLPGYFWEAQQ